MWQYRPLCTRISVRFILYVFPPLLPPPHFYWPIRRLAICARARPLSHILLTWPFREDKNFMSPQDEVMNTGLLDLMSGEKRREGRREKAVWRKYAEKQSSR